MKRKRILSVMMTMAMAAGTLGAGAGALNVKRLKIRRSP